MATYTIACGHHHISNLGLVATLNAGVALVALMNGCGVNVVVTGDRALQVA